MPCSQFYTFIAHLFSFRNFPGKYILYLSLVVFVECQAPRYTAPIPRVHLPPAVFRNMSSCPLHLPLHLVATHHWLRWVLRWVLRTSNPTCPQHGYSNSYSQCSHLSHEYSCSHPSTTVFMMDIITLTMSLTVPNMSTAVLNSSAAVFTRGTALFIMSTAILTLQQS